MAGVRRSKRVWIGVGVVLVLLFFAQRLAFPGEDDEATASDKVEQTETVQRVAQRVEEIRGLKFKEIPEVKVVTQDELAEEAQKIQEEAGSGEKEAAEQATKDSEAAFEVLRLTGLVPADFDPNAGGATGGGGSADIAGVYFFEDNTVRLVEETVEGEPELAEATLAHELTHALETQHFGSDEEKLSQSNEQSYGLLSLGEGSATVVEVQYAKRHLGVDKPLREFVGRMFSGGGDAKVPDVVEEGVAFPYRNGALFVDSLLRDAGGNDFKLVDEAWKRPPESTAEILHPDLWKKNVKPEQVDLGAQPVLGDGWKRIGGTDFGEFDTAMLMQLGASRGLAREAAEGWAGGAFEVFRSDDAKDDCKPPCREAQAVTIGWRWADDKEAAEQEKWVEPYIQKTLKPESGSDGTWELKDGGFAAYVRNGDASGLAFAPEREQAQKLAESAAG